jgi:hypothetical protein
LASVRLPKKLGVPSEFGGAAVAEELDIEDAGVAEGEVDAVANKRQAVSEDELDVPSIVSVDTWVAFGEVVGAATVVEEELNADMLVLCHQW